MQNTAENIRSPEEINISEIRYRRLFETARDGVLILDAETGKILDVNPFLIGALEYTKEEFIGKRLWEISPFKDILANKISFKNLQGKLCIRYDNLPLETKSGNKMEFEFVSNVYMEGNLKVIQCNIRDNSQRKLLDNLKEQQVEISRNAKEKIDLLNTQFNKANEDLNITRDTLSVIINTIGDPVFVKDENSVFILANNALCNMLGIERKNIIGKTLAESLPEDQMKHFFEMDKMVLDSGQENISEELLTGKDGKILNIITKKTRYVDKNGKRFLVSLIHDITESKRLEANALQSQKMESIGVLAGGIAHDFNNLLTIIMGNADLASKSVDKNSKAFEELKEISLTASRAAILTRQLLLYGRKHPMGLAPLNINNTITNILAMLKRLIGENIEIKVELDPGVGIIMADESNIEQVITNLCINARDAMPEGGVISIKSAVIDVEEKQSKIEDVQPGAYVRLSVSDTGCGIDKETIKRIFEPFFTTKGVGKGTGLGLSVVYGIIKAHCGWINVYSEPSLGSVFNIFLPEVKIKVTEKKEVKEELDNLKGSGESILLIEDNAGILLLMKKYLNENNYFAYTAENSEQAVKVFSANAEKIVLIISDFILPGKNGLETVKEIRQIKKGIPVIISSGYLEDKSKYSDILENGYGYIQKPFETKELLKLVREKLDNKIRLIAQKNPD